MNANGPSASNATSPQRHAPIMARTLAPASRQRNGSGSAARLGGRELRAQRGMVGRLREPLPEYVGRFGAPPERHQDDAEVVVGLDVCRIDRECAAELRDGVVVALHLQV